MNQTPKIELRDPATLTRHFHPALAGVPELSQTSEEFYAIAEGVKQLGIVTPLLVDESGRLLDDHSRTLLHCARRWQLATVPVQICRSEDAPLLLIHSLAHRRHLTKSAIAYLAYPLLKPAFENAREAKLKNLAKKPMILEVGSGDSQPKKVEDLGAQLGIERSLFFDAQRVHKAFESPKKYPRTIEGGAQDGEVKDMTLKEFYEPRILRAPVGGEHEQTRPLGLGAVLAGIASDGLNLGKPRKDRGQLELFDKAIFTLALRVHGLDAGAIRAQVRDTVDRMIEKNPELLDQFEQLGAVIVSEVKAKRKNT